ncbi:MAG: response regulator [Candidatus Anammoxibacter sp.]
MATILVIDDEKCILESFKLVLEPQNCVETASSGEEGIAKATMNPPDIIFLDLKMPGMGGIEALIRLQVICARIPTFIMSGFYEEHMPMLEKARVNGCSFGVCHKPMDSKRIKLIVKSVLEEHASCSGRIGEKTAARTKTLLTVT